MDELMEVLQSLHPEVDYDTCDRLVDDKIFRSFDIVTIVSEIYEIFGIAVPAEDIVPENFNSAKALFALVERLENE